METNLPVRYHYSKLLGGCSPIQPNHYLYRDSFSTELEAECNYYRLEIIDVNKQISGFRENVKRTQRRINAGERALEPLQEKYKNIISEHPEFAI